MAQGSETRSQSIPLGVVVRKQRTRNRWAPWSWIPVAVLPGAGAADWKLLREDADGAEYHAGTLEMELHRADTEAYRVALSNEPPTVYVVLSPCDDPDAAHDVNPTFVTASPFEAQDYLDSGEQIVEAVAMPPGLVAWVREFVEAHHVEETFKKRKRDRVRMDQVEDGRGDPRIRQMSDVYRAPSRKPNGKAEG